MLLPWPGYPEKPPFPSIVIELVLSGNLELDLGKMKLLKHGLIVIIKDIN